MDTLSVINRLKEYFNLPYTSEVCRKIGIGQQTLAGRVKRNTVPAEDILKALQDTDADLRHIFYGTPISDKKKYPINLQFFNDENNTSVDGNLICSSNFENIYIDPKLLPKARNGNMAAFTIRNESMGGTLKVGDIIFIDRNDTKITDGKIYIIEISGSIIIRRIFKMPDILILKSDNTTFPQYEIHEDEIKILGRVSDKITSL